MTTRRRSILLSLGLVALATVSLAATLDHWWYHPPNPVTAGRDELFRCLISHDLRQESVETQTAFLVRMIEELDQGIDFALIDEKLGTSDREMLFRNVDALLEDWFHALSKTYRNTELAERSARIDREIERVRCWGILEYLASQESRSGQKGHTDDVVAPSWQAIQDFNTRALVWIEHSDQASRVELRALLAAIRARVLVKAFESA